MTDDSDIDPRAPRPERPRYEPEIIPPNRAGADRRSRIWMSDEFGTRKVYVARPGPFAILLALVLAGLVAAATLIVLLGFVLIWIPAAIIVVGALLLSGTVRRYLRGLQSRALRR